MLDAGSRVLKGIGHKCITTLSYFETDVDLDGTAVAITFHVVKDRYIVYSAVIGSNVLDSVDMAFSRTGVKFLSKKRPCLESAVEITDSMKLENFEKGIKVDDETNKPKKRKSKKKYRKVKQTVLLEEEQVCLQSIEENFEKAEQISVKDFIKDRVLKANSCWTELLQRGKTLTMIWSCNQSA